LMLGERRARMRRILQTPSAHSVKVRVACRCITDCATRNARGVAAAVGSRRGYRDGKAQRCRDRLDCRCQCQRAFRGRTHRELVVRCWGLSCPARALNCRR